MGFRILETLQFFWKLENYNNSETFDSSRHFKGTLNTSQRKHDAKDHGTYASVWKESAHRLRRKLDFAESLDNERYTPTRLSEVCNLSPPIAVDFANFCREICTWAWQRALATEDVFMGGRRGLATGRILWLKRNYQLNNTTGRIFNMITIFQFKITTGPILKTKMLIIRTTRPVGFLKWSMGMHLPEKYVQGRILKMCHQIIVRTRPPVVFF